MDPFVDGWCSDPLTWFREHQLAEFDKNTVVFTGSPSISRHGPKDVVWTCVNPKTWGAHLKPMDIRTPFLGWSSRHIPSCWRRPKKHKIGWFYLFLSCILYPHFLLGISCCFKFGGLRPSVECAARRCKAPARHSAVEFGSLEARFVRRHQCTCSAQRQYQTRRSLHCSWWITV